MPIKPLICLIGAGESGQILIEYLKRTFRLIIIEKDSAIVKRLRNKYKSDEIEFLEGDATSALILSEASLSSVYQVIITMHHDASLKEIIDLLHERFHVKQISAKTESTKTANSLRKKGVNVVVQSEDVANLIINQMELGESFAIHVGKGEGEIMQIQLTNSSPLIDTPLKDLPPKPWIIGAIYRPRARMKLARGLPYIEKLSISKEDEFILPRGDTRPRAGDKLLLIGDPKVLRATAAYLKSGKPTFPTRHGDVVVSLFLVDEKDIGAHREYKWLLSSIEPTTMRFIYHHEKSHRIIEKLRLPAAWLKAGAGKKTVDHVRTHKIPQFIEKLALGNRLGLIIYKQPLDFFTRFLHGIVLLPRMFKLLRRSDSPLWIIRHHGPIMGISLYISAQAGTMRAAELAMDCAQRLNLPLTILQVIAPRIIAGSEKLREEDEMRDSVHHLAALYGMTSQEKVIEGNPVQEVLNNVPPEHLLVMAMPRRTNEGLFIPNVARKLEKKFAGSLLILPT